MGSEHLSVLERLFDKLSDFLVILVAVYLALTLFHHNIEADHAAQCGDTILAGPPEDCGPLNGPDTR